MAISKTGAAAVRRALERMEAQLPQQVQAYGPGHRSTVALERRIAEARATLAGEGGGDPGQLELH